MLGILMHYNNTITLLLLQLQMHSDNANALEINKVQVKVTRLEFQI